MRKKSSLLLAFISGLFLISINLVSASFHYGYGRFSFGSLLDSFDPSTIILGGLFIVFFAILNFSLTKVFRDKQTGEVNTGIAGVVSFVISLMIVYGINRSGLDYDGFFYDFFGTIGLSEDILFTILPILLLIVIIGLIWWFSFATTFIVFGGFLLVITIFTDIFYEKGAATLVGGLFLLIGFLWWRKKKRLMNYSPGNNYNYSQQGPSGPTSRQIYKQELANRKYQESLRQAQIKARAKSINEIRNAKEREDEYRRQEIARKKQAQEKRLRKVVRRGVAERERIDKKYYKR